MASKKITSKNSLPKAQLGKIVKTAAKAAAKTSKVAKVADKTDDVKNINNELSIFQKQRLASGKPVQRGSNPKGNMTMREIQAKKDLEKAIKIRNSPKKLSKEEQYLKSIEDSYKKTGGSVKKKAISKTNKNKK